MNVPKGEAYRHLFAQPPRRTDQPEPDQRLLATEASLADAARCLRRAVRFETPHRDEIHLLLELAEGLARRCLKESAR